MLRDADKHARLPVKVNVGQLLVRYLQDCLTLPEVLVGVDTNPASATIQLEQLELVDRAALRYLVRLRKQPCEDRPHFTAVDVELPDVLLGGDDQSAGLGVVLDTHRQQLFLLRLIVVPFKL